MGQPRPGCGSTEGDVRWLLGKMPEQGRELEPAQGPWDLGRGLTNDADADSLAFLGPMAGMGGHTAVGSLILRPYLREEQHCAGGKRQGRALGGGEVGQETITAPVCISRTPVFVSTTSDTLSSSPAS